RADGATGNERTENSCRDDPAARNGHNLQTSLLLRGLRVLIFRVHHVHYFVINDGVRRILNYFVVCLQAMDHFDDATIVTTDGDGYELRFAVHDGRDLQSFCTENKCGYRNDVGGLGAVELEMNLRVCAGYEFSLAVVYVNFHQQGARD